MFYTFLFSSMWDTCVIALAVFGLITQMMCGEKYKSWSSSSCNCLQSPIASSLLRSSCTGQYKGVKMVIGLIYYTPLPLFSSGTEHTEEGTKMIYSRRTDKMRWRLRKVCRLPFRRKRAAANVWSLPQEAEISRNLKGVLGFVSMIEEAYFKLVEFVANSRFGMAVKILTIK